MIDENRNDRDRIIGTLEPILTSSGFVVVAGDAATGGDVRFHVEGPELERFQSRHPDLYADFISSYRPQDVPCIDLIVTAGRSESRGLEFLLEGRTPRQLSRYLPSEIIDELTQHQNDELEQWLETAGRALTMLLKPPDEAEV